MTIYKVNIPFSIDLNIEATATTSWHPDDGADIDVDCELTLDNQDATPVILDDLRVLGVDEATISEAVHLAIDEHICGKCGERRYLFSTGQDEVVKISE